MGPSDPDECVINIPTVDLTIKVIGSGNCSGRDVDKFAKFGVAPGRGAKVMAPLISECYANFECRLHDASFIKKYSLFVWEVIKPTWRSPRSTTTARSGDSWAIAHRMVIG